MRFIRFVLAQRHPDSGVEDGTFRLASELRDSVHVEAADRSVLAEHLTWVREELGNAAPVQPIEVEGLLSSKPARNRLVQAIIDKLAALKTGACHQYLDGPCDDVQVMASLGEHGDAWWRQGFT
jgi:hypothetical protein